MNAAVRAVVRMGLFVGCKVFLIKEVVICLLYSIVIAVTGMLLQRWEIWLFQATFWLLDTTDSCEVMHTSHSATQ